MSTSKLDIVVPVAIYSVFYVCEIWSFGDINEVPTFPILYTTNRVDDEIAAIVGNVCAPQERDGA